MIQFSGVVHEATYIHVFDITKQHGKLESCCHSNKITHGGRGL